MWRGVCICFLQRGLQAQLPWNTLQTITTAIHAMEPRCSSPRNYRSLPRYAYPVLEVISIAPSALFRYANMAWLFQLWLCLDRLDLTWHGIIEWHLALHEYLHTYMFEDTTYYQLQHPTTICRLTARLACIITMDHEQTKPSQLWLLTLTLTMTPPLK